VDTPVPSGEQSPDLPDQPLRLSGQPVSTGQDTAKGEQGPVIEAGKKEDSKGSDSAAPQQVARRHGSAKPVA
jgi:hypothetical protein